MSVGTPHYDGWDSRHAIMAPTTKFVSYDSLVALLANWREVQLGVLSHSATVLSQVSTLGAANFFGKRKRFAGSSPQGDNIYISLKDARMKRILNNIITALQTVPGEGRAKRLGPHERNLPSGSDDSALNVAHQLTELDELLTDETFLVEACFTQEKFEHSEGLRWTGS
nr:MAG: putative coat protein [Jiangsu sediment virgavirus]